MLRAMRALGVVVAGFVLLGLWGAPGSAVAAAPSSCGAPSPDRVVTGTFTSDQTGSFVFLPFDVPAGTTAVRAWYCYDQPELPTSQLPAYAIRHTLDLGLYQPRPAGQAMWTMDEFRGWSGSGFFRDITVSPEGFAADPDPARKPVGKTSRGYRPGPIPAGTWGVELGVAAVVPVGQGDLDGKVAWRVELQLEDDPAFADEPYVPAPYDEAPARPGPGWYAGDFHVHTDQSGDAKHKAPAREVFDFAFRPLSAGGAGLDFVQATDHNTDAGWGEWGRHQSRYPGKLIARNEEITTYRGHVNAPGIGEVADYRTGAVFERAAGGALTLLRGPRPVSRIFDQVHASGGVAQINHPTIFDARIPPLGIICRGCSWEYDAAETDVRKADAVEVMTGPQGLKVDGVNPGPNPFTPLAIEFYEDAVSRAGKTIAAVSGSDSHAGGTSSPTDVTGSPVGSPATMVFAQELSEQGIADAVRSGRTYVRAFGLRSPELRFEARPVGAAPTVAPAIFGDRVTATSVRFRARVIGPGSGAGPLMLVVTRNGLPQGLVPVLSQDFTHDFTLPAPAAGTDRVGLLLLRGSAIEAFGTPIRITRPAPDPSPVAGLLTQVLQSAATLVHRVLGGR